MAGLWSGYRPTPLGSARYRSCSIVGKWSLDGESPLTMAGLWLGSRPSPLGSARCRSCSIVGQWVTKSGDNRYTIGFCPASFPCTAKAVAHSSSRKDLPRKREGLFIMHSAFCVDTAVPINGTLISNRSIFHITERFQSSRPNGLTTTTRVRNALAGGLAA